MYRATSQTFSNLARYAPARQFTPVATKQQQPTLLQHVQTWRASTQSTVVTNNTTGDGRDHSKSYIGTSGYGRDRRLRDSSSFSSKTDFNGGRVTTLLPSTGGQFGQQQQQHGVRQRQQQRTLTGIAAGSAREGQDTQRDMASFNERIKSLKREGNLLGVVREFSLMKNLGISRNLLTYNLVLDAFAELRQHKSSLRPMLDVFNELLKEPFLQPSSYTYRTMVRALCIRELEVLKLKVHLETRMQWIDDEAERARLAALNAEENFKQAMALFERARGEFSEPFDLNALDLLLWTAAEKGESEATLRIFEAVESSLSIVPGFQTYAALITSFGRAGDIEAARECFQVFLEQRSQLLSYGKRGRNQSLIPFNSMVSALARCNDMNAACHLVEVEMESLGVKPDEITYNALISGYTQAGDLDAAVRMFDKVSNDPNLPDPSHLSYNVILSAACKQDAVDIARRFFNLTKLHGVPIRYGNLMSYLDLCVKQSDIKEAADVIVIMERNGDTPDLHCRQLMRSLIEKQDIPVEGIKLFLKRFANLTLDYNDRHSMLRDLGVCFIDAHPDHFPEHVEIIETLHSHSVRFKMRLIESFMRAYRAYRNKHGINAIAQVMTQRVYIPLITAWYERLQSNDDLEQVFAEITELLRDMKSCNHQMEATFFLRMAKRFESADPDAVTRWRNTVVEIFGEEAVTSATQFIDPEFRDNSDNVQRPQQLQPRRHITDQENKEIWYLCNRLRAIGRIPAKINEVMKGIDKLLARNITISPEIARNVIQCCANSTRHQELDGLVTRLLDAYDAVDNQVERNSLRQQAISSAILAYAKRQDGESAWRMYKLLRIDGLIPSRTAYSELLRLYKGEDDVEEGMRMYQEMNSVPSAYFANIFLGKLARKLGFTVASELFDEMMKRGLQPTSVTYGTLISAACKEDNEEGAIRYFKELCLRPEKDNNPAPFHAMMQYSLSRNDRASILRYFTSIRRHLITPVPHTYRLLIEAYVYVEPRDMALAEQSLRDMLKANLQPNGAHFAPLFHGYADEGRADRVEWLWEEMKVQAHLPDEIAYLAAIAAAEKCGHHTFAQKLRDEMFATMKQNTNESDAPLPQLSSTPAQTQSSADAVDAVVPPVQSMPTETSSSSTTATTTSPTSPLQQ
ncbi:hypothetical protein BDF22DRAFT_686190 [Syncephalis plumigaleata]|nr:hypothetical protein BDF22DRAFT_686190 [Syncephalis plumigaleata]